MRPVTRDIAHGTGWTLSFMTKDRRAGRPIYWMPPPIRVQRMCVSHGNGLSVLESNE